MKSLSRLALVLGSVLWAYTAFGGTMSLEISLHAGSVSGFNSFASYSYDAPFYESTYGYSFGITHVITNSDNWTGSSVSVTWSRNLATNTNHEPDTCYTAMLNVGLSDPTVPPTVTNYAKQSAPICYPPPPPPKPDDPVNGPGTCNDPNCMGQWEPLVLDLNGDGVNTTATDDMVWFDLNGDGDKDHITWTNKATIEGFLWINLGGKNRVDDGTELFGIGTVMPGGTKARDGFEALEIYDRVDHGGNADGVIDSNDAAWNKLRVWIDANHNGICEPGEVSPLAKYGVEGISLARTRTSVVDAQGNGHYLTGYYWRHIGGRLEYFKVDGLTFQGDNQ